LNFTAGPTEATIIECCPFVGIAQMEERVFSKDEVLGSVPRLFLFSPLSHPWLEREIVNFLQKKYFCTLGMCAVHGKFRRFLQSIDLQVEGKDVWRAKKIFTLP
jgi:hypothetical protein